MTEPLEPGSAAEGTQATGTAGESAGPQRPAAPGPATSTGIEPKVAGLLCYLLGFVTGVIFLLVEKESRFVRFHAMQSTLVFGGLFVVTVVLGAIPLLGWLLTMLLVPCSLLLWVVLMIKALQGDMFQLPWIGAWAERQL